MKRNQYYIIAFISILIISCYKESDYNKPFDPALISTSISNKFILADGVSKSQIRVEIPADADDNFSQIIFKTSAIKNPSSNKQKNSCEVVCVCVKVFLIPFFKTQKCIQYL